MITKEELKKVSDLAKIEVSDSEAQELSEQLSKALGHFQQIAQVNTEGIAPLVTPTEIEAYWREDKVQGQLAVEDILANAPDRLGQLFKVPPVV